MSPKYTPEEQARKKINEQLRNAGWEKIGEHVHYDNIRKINKTGYIEELGTDTGPSDYGLLINGNLAAVIEAKPAEENAAGHFQQAERYAASVNGTYAPDDSYGIPLTFVATGEGIHLYDFRQSAPASRPISSFYTPEGLRRLATRDYDLAHNWLQEVSVAEFDPDLWDHQKECVNAVEESLHSRELRMLIKMATGSGKTRTAQALTYRLLESSLADNVLFIPDTRKLANDAYNSFSGYEPTGADVPFSDKYRIVNLEDNEESRLDRGEVVITTLQKMYYLLDSNEVNFHPGDFDVIITDECHRSIYQNDGYGSVLQHFDAIEIGLTATPTQQTISRFDNNLVYEYGYEEAVADNHVVPFQMYALETEITMSGVIDSETGEYYPPNSLGSEVLVPDTHRKVGEELREKMTDEHELTLIFARNDNHATRIVQDLRETVFSDKPANYIQKITYKADRPEETLNRFSDPYDPSPAIAVTVQMVSTGVDIRPLENVVLLNPVKSPVLFNQMLGRGSRVYDDKTHFNIYDCVGAFQYFEGTPPFGTLDYEKPEADTSSTKKTDEGVDEGPAIVDVPDEVIRSEPVFPTESGERLTAEGFRRAFKTDVQSDSARITETIRQAPDIETANNNIRSILQENSRYYIPVFLEKAYQPLVDQNKPLLIDFVNEALTGKLPSFEERVENARSQLKEHGITELEQEYLQLMAAIATPPNGISKRDFYDPPISNLGGLKRAKQEFETFTPTEFISEFRSELSDIIGEQIAVHEDDPQENKFASERIQEKLKSNIIRDIQQHENLDVDEEQIDQILSNSIEIEIHKEGTASEFELFYREEPSVDQGVAKDTLTFTHSVIEGPSPYNTERKPPITARVDPIDAITVGSAVLTGSITSNPAPGLIALYTLKNIVYPEAEPITPEQAFTYGVGWEMVEEGSYLHQQVLIEESIEKSKERDIIGEMNEDDVVNALQELAALGSIDIEDTDGEVMIWFKDEFNVEYTVNDN